MNSRRTFEDGFRFVLFCFFPSIVWPFSFPGVFLGFLGLRETKSMKNNTASDFWQGHTEHVQGLLHKNRANIWTQMQKIE